MRSFNFKTLFPH